MQKISIVGAGRVGESTAQFLARENLCREIVLVDVKDGVPQGAALDIQETAPLFGFDTRLSGATDGAAMAGSGLVIITAGIPRKPGMSRSDVLDTNVAIIDKVMEDVVKHAPDAMVLVVSNPVDVLTYRAWKKSGWPRNRVFGQAGVLDSSRMAYFVASETGLSVKNIHAMVLGGHGDAMVPLIRYTTISGIPIEHFLDRDVIDRIIERTRHGGAEILALKQTSSAYDAPAAAIAEMVDAIVRERRQVLPTVAILDGEYGYDNVAMGVPCVLGRNGMEEVVALELNHEEHTMFDESLAGVVADIERLNGT
ncbi:MAG: malate dehydrogenase [Gammaproteobacteria bacterium]|nr:malate dehydrogenase [Gammaproteobacteria bacterium]